MPPQEESHRFQVAVLWPKVGVDGYGAVTRGNAEEIQVRWVWKRRDIRAPDGSRISVDATVHTVENLRIGDRLWLGALEDWYGTGSGGDDSEVLQVVAFDYTPDVKGRAVHKQAMLAKSRDGLPDFA